MNDPFLLIEWYFHSHDISHWSPDFPDAQGMGARVWGGGGGRRGGVVGELKFHGLAKQ